ncbi:VQ motif-containing protein [Artemisia annua]|uniref:VQ motif-containing protein n=1 Tax=Artemisia annua TaxID=35608 RepID=A0A2U1P3K5_ARTAN|nr:VQ motif-containing protein [Artemisia annua]
MDSSNSGSYQSSSGGAADTEEYNSRTQQSSISSFLNNNNNNNNNNHFNNLIQPPSSNNTFFNPTTSLNPVQDLSSLWTGTLQQQLQQPVQPVQDRFNTFQQIPNSLPIDTNPKPGQPGREPGHHHMGVIKNPKKRTRASRRAPTTVLTTDTTNFRQMVQEFTGIPTGPFTGGAPLSRRLDLFRPSATKFQPVQVQQPSFLNSLNNDNIHPSSINDFSKQPSGLVDMQNNPMLSFQSLLQTTMNNTNQDSNDLSGFASSSKRWSGQDEKLENFEGVIEGSLVRFVEMLVSSRVIGHELLQELLFVCQC